MRSSILKNPGKKDETRKTNNLCENRSVPRLLCWKQKTKTKKIEKKNLKAEIALELGT